MSPAAWGLIARTGSTGATGAQGKPGPVGVNYVTSPDKLSGGQVQSSGIADCPVGQSVIGGGIQVDSLGTSTSPVHLISSYPLDTADDTDTIPNNAWAAVVDNTTLPTTTIKFRVCAICTSATSVN